MRTARSLAAAGEPAGGLRIALLHPTYWPEVRRGAERLVHDVAAGMNAAGHRATVLTSSPGASARAVEDGIEVVRNRRLPEGLARAAGYDDRLGHLPATWRSLTAGDFDIAHSMYPMDAALAVRWSKRRRARTVFTITGIPRRDVLLGRLWRRRAWKLAVRSSDAVVVLSEAARQRLEWLAPQARVLHPGVDLERFQPSAERAPAPTILCPASLEDPRKRGGQLLEAFAGLRRRYREARLILCRQSESAVPERAAEGVEFRELDSGASLARAYSEAWVTVLAAEDEAFGLVLVESLACGTPVVARSDAGMREVVSDDGHGFLFRGGAAELERSLELGLDLAEDGSVAARCRGRAEQFSLGRCVEGHLRMYAGLRA
jgi:glycosyltransferase involved in cell wall biosynthesis